MKLNQYELENIEDCFDEFEKKFNIKFEDEETQKLTNFDEFCELAISKIQLEKSDTCTSQQVFYKFRKALIESKILENSQILKPSTELNVLFPRKNRIIQIKKIETQFGYKLDILKAPNFITQTLFYLFVIFFALLFIKWKIGLLGLSSVIFGFYLCKFGKELEVKNVRELVDKITAQEYFDIKKDKNTVNKSELKSVITNWFADNAGIEKEKLKIATFG